jgi:hypothetical protein
LERYTPVKPGDRRGGGYFFARGRIRGIFILPMTTLLSTLFWDKKVKIAILTLATFAALC